MWKSLVATGALAAIVPTSAQAASQPELEEIRAEIKQLKDSYESRIQALEQRLKQAETKADQAQSAAVKAESAIAQAAAPPASAPSAANAFNPAISLILSGAYANLQRDPQSYRIGGFMPSGEGSGPGRRGFRLAESELAVNANIDPYFFGSLTLALTPENTVSVEEAYFKTSALPNGFSIKGGRFFSGVGYLNEIHAHAWDFTDHPLAYQAFLGKQYAQEGMQLKWLAPTDTFLEFGAETGNGSRFPGTERNKNGSGSGAAFVHVGDDLGVSNSWRAGFSLLRHAPRERSFEDAINKFTDSFTGSSTLWIADLIWKWAPNGNPSDTNFKLQGEYFRRKEQGELTFDSAGAALSDRYAATQSGWYLQGVYQFMPRWRAGLRYDRLDSGSMALGAGLSGADFPSLAAYRPNRSTLMFDYNPSEFSRIRLQFARDQARPEVTDHQIVLQYLHSLGAHGGHKF